jgi:hypothetical protein
VPVKKPSKDAPPIAHILARGHIDIRALKMAGYGFFVAAPLSHFLVGLLQKAFAGKTGAGARVAQILASNLLVAPVQTAGECDSYRFPFCKASRTQHRAPKCSVPGIHGCYCRRQDSR